MPGAGAVYGPTQRTVRGYHERMNRSPIEELLKTASRALPPGLAAWGEDARHNLHALIEAALSRLDLVTREEFEVQRALLERSQRRVAELEARLAKLEGK